MPALSNQARTEIIAALMEMDTPKLTEALVAAVEKQPALVFPASMETLREQQKSLERASEKGHKRSVEGFKNSIAIYLEEAGCDDFKKSLTDPNEQINNELLHFLAQQLNITFNSTPIVRAAILNGKILWRIVKNDKTIYQREHFNGINGINILDNKEQCWEMSWEQFRQFRDSGKRSSSVAVTKARFVEQFPDNKKEAKTIWQSLRNQGVLTRKNKISPAFYAVTNQNISIPNLNENFYEKIINAIESIQNDKTNREKITANDHSFRIFRANSTGKKWQGTGRVINDTSKHPSLIWQVGTHSELDAHRDDNEETHYGEILNYDHIPSIAALSQESDDKKIKKKSLTIAIRESLHRQGDTYLKSTKNQALNSKNVFLRDVATYMKIFKRDNMDVTEQLLALGAFRHLYHSHTKTPPSIESHTATRSGIKVTSLQPITDAGLSFFSDENKKEIDQFFTQEMQRITKLL